MRGKASLVFAQSWDLVLLPGTLTSLAAYNAWFARSQSGFRVQTQAINSAVSRRLHRGSDRGSIWGPR